MSEPYLPNLRVSPAHYATFAAFIGVHLACFGMFWTGVSAADAVLMVSLYYLRMFGVTGGYHRYFAHRAYKTSRAFQFFLAFLAQSSLQSGALWWAAKHRDHHSYSDTERDTHSPRQYGFWFSHCGWIFNEKAGKADYSRIPEFTAYPELVWLDKNQFVAPLLMGLGVWSLFGWSGLFVGFFGSSVLLYHGTFAINSLAHVVGRQRYLTGDDSRNNWWLALLTLGEGWHNNHHYFMSSTRQGFRWWEVDGTFYILKMLSWGGLVWDLREPPAHVLAGQRGISAELKERVAAHLANSFPIERIVQRVQQRWVEAHPGANFDELRRRFHEAVEQRREQWSHIAHPELPSLDELHRKARRMFARSPAMEEIVARARELLEQSVQRRLTTLPA